MNAKKLFCCTFSSLLFALPLTASAAIIDGTFKATVTKAETHEGLWSDIFGDTVTGTFSYDTGLAAKQLFVVPNEARYISHTNTFVNMTFNIAGKTFDVSRDYVEELVPASQIEMVIVRDHDTNVAGSTRDVFTLFDNAVLTDERSGSVHNTGEFYIFDTSGNLLDDTNIEQEFNWVNEGKEGQGAAGSFNYFNTLDGNNFWTSVDLNITEVTASLRKTSVPEPTPLILLGTALLGMALRFRKTLV